MASKKRVGVDADAAPATAADPASSIPAAIAHVGPTPAAQVDVELIVLAQRLLDVCVARGLTVATAESCTGGLVAHTMTRIPGSSAYLLGGVVSYADGVKIELLDVPAPVLAAHGAVSAQVARAMATGARDRLHADLAVSVTGIAGPDGGGPSKPVGLTYIAVADSTGVDVRRFVWPGDRAGNVAASVHAALGFLLERTEAVETTEHGPAGAASRNAGSSAYVGGTR